MNWRTALEELLSYVSDLPSDAVRTMRVAACALTIRERIAALEAVAEAVMVFNACQCAGSCTRCAKCVDMILDALEAAGYKT